MSIGERGLHGPQIPSSKRVHSRRQPRRTTIHARPLRVISQVVSVLFHERRPRQKRGRYHTFLSAALRHPRRMSPDDAHRLLLLAAHVSCPPPTHWLWSRLLLRELGVHQIHHISSPSLRSIAGPASLFPPVSISFGVLSTACLSNWSGSYSSADPSFCVPPAHATHPGG